MDNIEPKRTVEQKKLDFIERQTTLDNIDRPKLDLLQKNTAKYYKAWEKYIQKTQANVKAFKADLDYYHDLEDELKARKLDAASDKPTARGKHIPGGKLQQLSAKQNMSDASKTLNTGPHSFGPHFEPELAHLIAANPKHAALLAALPRHSEAFSRALNDELLTQLPQTLLTKLKRLPYRHPASQYLKLTKAQNKALAKDKERRRAEAHRNAPTAIVGDFEAFATATYQNRATASLEALYIAFLIVTGRRKFDAVIVTFSPSDKPGYIVADTLTKKRPVYNPDTNSMTRPLLDLPIAVVFLSSTQALELIDCLVQKLKDKVGLDVWTEIKETGKSKAWDKIMANVRKVFKKNLYVAPFPTAEQPAPKQIAVHRACRAVYSKVARKQLSTQKPNSSDIGFANDALAHEPKDLKTTSDYLTVNVRTHKPIETPKPETKKIISFDPKDIQNLKSSKTENAIKKLFIKNKNLNTYALHKFLTTNPLQPLDLDQLIAKAGSKDLLKTYLEVTGLKGVEL